MFDLLNTRRLQTIVFALLGAVFGCAQHARAAASLPDQCLYALNRSASGALTVSGSVNLNLGSCGIVVDSNSDSALVVSGGATITAKYIDVAGGYAGNPQATFSVAPQTAAPYRPDPLRFLTPPPAGKCDYTNVNVSSGSVHLSPGTYCNGISVSGTASVTLAPGTYILMGGGLRVSGSSQLSGKGTIVLTQGLGYSYGPVIVSDSALLNLQALQNGDYPGILFYQDGRLGQGIAPSVFNGSRNSKLEGVLYFPTSAVTWSGVAAGSQGAYFAIVADTIHITGSATIDTNYGALQRWLQLASFLGLQGGSAAQTTPAQPAARIVGGINNNSTFALAGNVHPLIALSTDVGEADSSLVLPRIVMHFNMTQAQQTALAQLLAAQQDKSSPLYHKWLTPEQFAARFGASESDVNQVSAWLQSMGFTDVQVARGRTFISMTGTVAQVRYAFQTPVHKYVFNGRSHYANATNPVLPQAFQGLVAGIRGLNDFHPHPRGHLSVIRPHFTSSISGNHFLAPEDFQIIYAVKPLIQSGITGNGQSIAIAGQSDIQLSDIEAFEAASGLPVKDPQVILDGPDPGTNSGDLSEADLDIEWAGGVAPGASIIYVNSSDAFTSMAYAIDNNLASVLSITYGDCEADTGRNAMNSLNTTFQQANAQGITIVAAAGDSGAADCDAPTNPNSSGVSQATQGLAVDFPASSPYVTGGGGSEFNEGSGTYWNATNDTMNGSATGYIPEMVWNDTSTDGVLSAGGGGASAFFSKPSWQQGPGVPNDAARDVPDIALSASADHDGYLVCTGGSCVNGFRDANQDLQVFGGTSAVAPTFAAIVALINQQTNSRQGNVNPSLYSLASISTDAFHDITVGNNQVPCKTGSVGCPTASPPATQSYIGYLAGPGYDQATGLGSIDAYNLASEWNSDFTINVNPASITLTPGTSGTATVQVTAVAGFKGTVQFSCSVASSLTGTTCSIPGNVNGSGSATLTVTASSTASTWHIWPTGPRFLQWTGLLAAGLALLLFTRKRARTASLAVFSLSVFLVACGSGNSSSPSASIQSGPSPVVGNVTINATSGNLTRTATVAVTVD